MTDDIELRAFRPDEFTATYQFTSDIFFDTWHEEDCEVERALFEFDRSIILKDGTDTAGTASAYSRETTVPGGATVPTAAVTWVGVAPTHRRRGLLTRMMTHQLRGLHGSAEPIASLWASESAIYGRFGYGMAIQRGRVEARIRDIPVRADLRPAGGRFRQLAPETALPDMAAVYERARAARVGFLDRPDIWWKNEKLYDPEHNRDGATPIRAAVLFVDDRPEAYALYRIKESATAVGPDSLLRIEELIGTSGAAELAMWDFVTSLDLLRRVEWHNAPVDMPIRHAVAEPRAMAHGTADSIWVRLVDVDRALVARTYSAPLDVVLDVADSLCSWNAGTWRLRAEPGKPATYERTNAAADLSLSVTELGAAYLGGTSLATLAAAGRVHEHRPGALREATIAFLEPRPPYCNDDF